MARLNPKYDVMVGNPISLQIPWLEDEEQFKKWKNGMTGYPFIDAGQRQLLQEGSDSFRLYYSMSGLYTTRETKFINDLGWMHHSVRNASAMFLTRGDSWLNWYLE
jgi:cryptochrome